MAVGIQAVLVDPTWHLGAEFFQQPVTGRQGLVHPAPLGDVDADRQVTHPQPLLIEHRCNQHVGQQVAAILAHQGPVNRLRAALAHGFGEHRLTSADLPAIAQAQGMGAAVQLFRLHQILQREMAQRLAGRITQHALGTGVEGADHPSGWWR